MHRIFAYALVAAQFTLSAVLVATTRLATLCFGCLVMTGLGVALALWAWLVMGLRRLSIFPHVRSDAELITAMPYQVIRHPMYSGLLLFCGGLILTNHSAWRTATWVLLAITLDLKARLEERLLADRFPAYHEHQRRTWRFVPFIY